MDSPSFPDRSDFLQPRIQPFIDLHQILQCRFLQDRISHCDSLDLKIAIQLSYDFHRFLPVTRTIPFDPGTPKERHFIRIRLKLRSIDHQDRSLQRFLILDAQINLMTDFFQGSFQLIIDKALIGFIGRCLSLKKPSAAQIVTTHFFQLTQGRIAITGIGKQKNRK